MANTSKHAFVRQESWRYKRVKPAWRRARGVTSKMRKEEAGWPPKVKVGYGTAARTRGLHPRGLQERLIYRLSELAGLDPKIHIVKISARVGERKRLLILEELRQRSFHVANPGKAEERPVAPEELVTGEQEPETTQAARATKDEAQEIVETSAESEELEEEAIDKPIEEDEDK
jgi:large subunit ribosomal protein L32e